MIVSGIAGTSRCARPTQAKPGLCGAPSLEFGFQASPHHQDSPGLVSLTSLSIATAADAMLLAVSRNLIVMGHDRLHVE